MKHRFNLLMLEYLIKYINHFFIEYICFIGDKNNNNSLQIFIHICIIYPVFMNDYLHPGYGSLSEIIDL